MSVKEEFVKLSDEELVARYHAGEESAADFLMEKYKNLVRMKARTYFLTGADNDDLIQEGMIGLYKAVRDYNPDKDAVFMTFASLCISRQIRTAITTYNRKKNSPLNSYISFDATVTDEKGNDTRLGDVLTGTSSLNPEELFIDQEQTQRLLELLNTNLSKMELQVLELFKEGLSYAAIAEHLQKSPKAVDNAVQRIRSKINQIRIKNS